MHRPNSRGASELAHRKEGHTKGQRNQRCEGLSTGSVPEDVSATPMPHRLWCGHFDTHSCRLRFKQRDSANVWSLGSRAKVSDKQWTVLWTPIGRSGPQPCFRSIRWQEESYLNWSPDSLLLKKKKQATIILVMVTSQGLKPSYTQTHTCNFVYRNPLKILKLQSIWFYFYLHVTLDFLSEAFWGSANPLTFWDYPFSTPFREPVKPPGTEAP